MIISIIVAIGNNNVVGINNSLPWNLPADLAYFRQMTIGKPIIMGQKTFESIGSPLSGRTNIILSRDDNFHPTGAVVAQSIEQALDMARGTGAEEVMIAGGVSIYGQFLTLADRMYLTLIDGDFEGDAFFPTFDYNDWEEKERIENNSDKDNPYRYIFLTLERKKKNQ